MWSPKSSIGKTWGADSKNDYVDLYIDVQDSF